MQEDHQDEVKAMEGSLKTAQDTIEAQNKNIYQQGIDIVDQYEAGFRRALGQVKFLHPSINVSEADPFKGIQDGHGVVLDTRLALSIQPKEDGDVEPREHISHTRCLVQGKVCSMILDGGSCTNVVSTILVEKINLQTAKHPRPYKLLWLTSLVPFTIENYKDEVLCDVVLIEAGHILLGRPWQLDRKVTHKGYTNCLSFIYNELKITLTPFSPKQVCEDQIKMRKVRECKLREEQLSIQEKERKENMSENKKKKEKHEIECSEEKSKKMSAFAKKKEVESALLAKEKLLVLMYKDVYFTNEFHPSFPFEEFIDVFPNEVPHGLPPLRGIEHQIRPAYRTNPEETKEIQKQVNELLQKDFVRESLSSCFVL
ncbi:hypothetical protein CR513_20177, partial [Mucuna pruriens]